MKHKNVIVYEIIFLIFTLISSKLILTEYGEYIIAGFFLISAFVLYKLLGFKRRNLSVKKDVIQITIISLLFYVLITYLSGLILGFLRNTFSLTLKSVFMNTLPLLTIIVCQELIRYMISCKSKQKVIILTVLYCIFDFVYYYNSNMNTGIYMKFVFATTQMMPMIARHFLSTYFCRKVSYIPGLILRLYFGISVLILPIFPDLGDFINSVLGVLFPYIIYYINSKLIVKAEQERIPALNKQLYYVYVPIIASLLFIVGLTSGLFKYHMIAIMSGSMEPTFYRGDAIIYEKTKKIEDIKDGTAIVFKHEGKYVTHRIVSIKLNGNNKYVIQTKGDNNPENDNYSVMIDDVLGVIKSKISGIGYPTVWFNELMN